MGTLFSFIAGVGMLMRIELSPGMVIDGRIILVGLAGAYGGRTSGMTAGILVATFRVLCGGIGAWTGCAGILGGSIVGIFFWFKRKPGAILFSPGMLILMGVSLTAQAQLLALLMLPSDIAWPVIKRVSIPGFLFYPIGTLVIGTLFHFISQHNELNTKLLQSETLLNATQKLAKVGGWEWDVEKKIMFWTKQVYDIHGFDLSEVLPGSTKHIDRSLECYDTHDRSIIMAAFNKCIEEGHAYDLEFPFTTGKGERGWIRIAAKAVMDGDRIIKVIGNIRDITEDKRAEEQLRTLLKEKDVLLRELYHRTKNNMQVIRAMLLLQAAKMPENEQAQKLVKDTENRIMVMALVHQKLYQSHDLSRVPIQDYIGELAQLIMQSYTTTAQNISLAVEVENLSLLLDTAIPCGLILNELLSNALKYAFPDHRHGKISIRLFRNESKNMELLFVDNGVGVPPGFDFRGQDTLGLQTVIAIAEHQMQGRVRFTGEQGVTCTIEFPDTLYSERV